MGSYGVKYNKSTDSLISDISNTDDGYKALAIAIVMGSIDDLKRALRFFISKDGLTEYLVDAGRELDYMRSVDCDYLVSTATTHVRFVDNTHAAGRSGCTKNLFTNQTDSSVCGNDIYSWALRWLAYDGFEDYAIGLKQSYILNRDSKKKSKRLVAINMIGQMKSLIEFINGSDYTNLIKMIEKHSGMDFSSARSIAIEKVKKIIKEVDKLEKTD